MRCVLAQHFTIRKALRWKSAIEERPPYQRESAVWSLDKQQLFIDSLLNGYDVPKIYLHDLRGEHPTKVYAIVDGKQRLTTLWSFLTDGFALANDFRIEPRNVPPEVPDGAVTPVAGLRFSELDPVWRRLFEETFLSVVLIRHATEADIEDLFSRLNNGEPLNAAEKRNAMGGDLVRMIRDVARRPFFVERLHFSNVRHQHHDLAARLLALEWARLESAQGIPDLRGPALDGLVRDHRRLAGDTGARLQAAVEVTLTRLDRVFGPRDPLLGSPAQALLAYLFVREAPAVADAVAATGLRTFLDWFNTTRLAALDLPETERDPTLVEFSELSQHGTHEARNIERRLAIVRASYERWEPSGRRDGRRRVRPVRAHGDE
ncbi:MAG: DUF262 domain-containing protein [Candidatus Limnocylindrales bacterium]